MTDGASQIRSRIVLIALFGDPTFQWHARPLLVHSGVGRWIVSSQHKDLQVLDVSTQRVVPMRGCRCLNLVRGAWSHMQQSWGHDGYGSSPRRWTILAPPSFGQMRGSPALTRAGVHRVGRGGWCGRVATGLNHSAWS